MGISSLENTQNSSIALNYIGGGEIAQWLASLSVKLAVQVRAQHDPLVSERWNSVSVLLTHSHQC